MKFINRYKPGKPRMNNWQHKQMNAMNISNFCIDMAGDNNKVPKAKAVLGRISAPVFHIGQHKNLTWLHSLDFSSKPIQSKGTLQASIMVLSIRDVPWRSVNMATKLPSAFGLAPVLRQRASTGKL